MAYDAKRQRLILHGGRAGTGRSGASLADTWAWDGERWTPLATDGPAGRDHHRMTYDRSRDRVVLFGGWDGERVLGDTWEWDGSRWNERDAGGPPARAPSGLAYDEARAEVVLFGGGDLDETYGDTWRWGGERWERADVDGPAPAPRTFHGATYDPDREELLVFSGRDGDDLFTDTWAWNGLRSTLLDDDGPHRRGVYALAYDRRRGVALFHGSGLHENGRWRLEATTWLWDGESWRIVAPAPDAKCGPVSARSMLVDARGTSTLPLCGRRRRSAGRLEEGVGVRAPRVALGEDAVADLHRVPQDLILTVHGGIPNHFFVCDAAQSSGSAAYDELALTEDTPGRLAGTWSLAEGAAPPLQAFWDLSFTTGVVDPTAGAVELPPDGGEAGAAYLAYVDDLAEGDVPALRRFIDNPYYLAEDAGPEEIAADLELMRAYGPVSARIAGGLAEDGNALLEVEATMADGGIERSRVLLQREPDGWTLGGEAVAD